MNPKTATLKPVITMILLLWIIHLISHIIPLQNYGIKPRDLHGLIGIVTAPFLHADLYHLINNSIGLLIFGLIFRFLEGKQSLLIILSIIFIQGTLTWIMARNGNHIGASGVIFGLYGYLLFAGFFHHQFKYILASIFILFFYGGMIFGVLPSTPGISWEGHLFGFIAGVLEAKFKKIEIDKANESKEQ